MCADCKIEELGTGFHACEPDLKFDVKTSEREKAASAFRPHIFINFGQQLA